MALAGVGGLVQLSMLMSEFLVRSASESSSFSSSDQMEGGARGRQSIGSRQELDITKQKIRIQIKNLISLKNYKFSISLLFVHALK